MVVSIRSQAPVSTSLNSLVKGFILTQRTDCRSPNTIEYYDGILSRFLWYAEQNNWPDDARLVTEWHIRELLAYVSNAVNRWGVKGNGSESSRRRATYSTVHHYYCVLKSFFNWCVREDYIPESPLIKIKLANPKPNVVRAYTSQEIMKLMAICDHDFKNGAKFLGSRNKAVVLMLLDTGLRISELAGIKLDDIETERGWIKVKGKGAKERMVRIGATAQKAGKIINIGSIDGREAIPSFLHYCCSKAGVHMLSDALSKEVAQHNINVNCVAPGAIWGTHMMDWVLRYLTPRRADPKEAYVGLCQRLSTLGREQTPEDVANAMLFLASEESRNITGYTIYVDGGHRGAM